ncbi:MAG TPA: hypothetical protein VMX33_02735 [bacterium]|nr:hypothetical protein [bacterium]
MTHGSLGLLAIIVVLAIIAFSVLSCASFKKSLDTGGLSDLASQVIEDGTANGSSRAGQADLEKYLAARDSSSAAHYRLVSREPFDRWKPAMHGDRVVGERLRFRADLDASIPGPLGTRTSSMTDSYFYFFHGAAWSGQKAIVWAPGFGVSDFAFVFIRRLIEMELSRGWAVLVWVPPFHLERQNQGKRAGQGLMTLDPRDLLGSVLDSTAELANGVNWLRSQGVTRIGGWGGSFGAASLLLLARSYQFDHITLMIPLLDWTTLWQNAALAPLRQALLSAGYDEDILHRAFMTISPFWHTLLTDPHRVQILYARYDQLTPEHITLAYADKLRAESSLADSGPVVDGYAESHGTILLCGGMYRAYGEFLDGIDQ